MNNSEDNNKATPKDDKSAGEDTSSRWRLAEHVFAVIGAVASLIAIVGVIIVGVEHTSIFEMHREEGMVSSLIPGDDYAKMAALIGTQPDFHESLSSGRQIYVYDRRWEYIQLLLDQNGTVLSVGVYAKTTAFKVTLVTGVVLNGPPISRQVPFDLITGAYGGCGASWYFYYQGYSLPEVQDARSEIVGDLPVVDTNKAQDAAPLCGVLFSSKPCVTAYNRSYLGTSEPSLSSKLIACIESVKAGQAYLSNLAPAIVIVTAPDQVILPDMLNYNYFATLAHT